MYVISTTIRTPSAFLDTDIISQFIFVSAISFLTISIPSKIYFYEGNKQDKILGEFICNKVDVFFAMYNDHGSADLTPSKVIYGLGNADKENKFLDSCCFTHDELFDYIIGEKCGHGLHVSRLKFYDKPKSNVEVAQSLC